MLNDIEYCRRRANWPRLRALFAKTSGKFI
jgi:hypothetical protein